MWTYVQLSGQLIDAGGQLIAVGYSGSPAGKNNPQEQSIADVGPIPQGSYTIGPPHDTPEHGPYVLSLTAAATNPMFGRSGFLMHGDSVAHPGCASEGCIIMGLKIRQQVWASGDHQLRVVSEANLPQFA
jgi:hypothetical protein